MWSPCTDRRTSRSHPPAWLLAPLLVATCYSPGLAPAREPTGILIEVTAANPYDQLTLGWQGRWLQDTEGSRGLTLPPTLRESASTTLEATDAFDGQRLAFASAGDLRPGLWEFAITGSVSSSDVFLPVVCRQEIFDQKIVNLEAVEGRVACTSDMGGDPSPFEFLWGSDDALTRETALPQGEARAFPAAAARDGTVSRLFLLLRSGTETAPAKPGNVPRVLAAFYQDQGGQPGPMMGTPLEILTEGPLLERGRLQKVVESEPDTWRLAGDTWIWVDVLDTVEVAASQTYSLGLLDPCTDPVACPDRSYLFLYAGQATPAFRGGVPNATALPDSFAGTPTANNLAPLAAVAVGRPPPIVIARERGVPPSDHDVPGDAHRPPLRAVVPAALKHSGHPPTIDEAPHTAARARERHTARRAAAPAEGRGDTGSRCDQPTSLTPGGRPP